MMETTTNHLMLLFSLTFVVYAQVVYGQPVGLEIVGPDPVTGFTGTDITLVCRDRALREGEFTWFKDGAELRNDSSKYSIENSKNESEGYISMLTIKDGQLADNGKYECRRHTSASSRTVELSMDADISIKDVSGGFQLAKGTTMKCEATGGNVSLSWSKGGRKLPKGKHDLNGDGVDDLEVNGDNEVVLLSADPVLTGEYTCTADLGSTEKSVSQQIVGELDIFAEKSIKVSEGEDGKMECRVRTIGSATITWSVNGSEVGPSDKYKIDEKDDATGLPEVISTLTIKKVTMADGRPTNYTCSATNGVDEMSADIILRIRDRLAALWPFIGIVSEVIILIVIILIHEACTKGEDIGEVEDDEEDHLLQKNRNTITRDGERETRMRGTNN